MCLLWNWESSSHLQLFDLREPPAAGNHTCTVHLHSDDEPADLTVLKCVSVAADAAAGEQRPLCPVSRRQDVDLLQV